MANFSRRINGKLMRFMRGRKKMMPLGFVEAKELMRKLEQTKEVECSCKDVYDRLNEFAEMVANGVDPAKIMPLIQHHIDLCDNCREEFEALLKIVKSSLDD
jgi:hypothetical protein